MDIPITLKWGKASYTNKLSTQPGSSAYGLKLKVQSLTGVPVQRQKLLSPKAWKGALKDDDIIPDNIAVPSKGKDSIVVTLIGSAESLVEKPFEERPRFSEDMTPEEIWKAQRAGIIDDQEEGGDHDNVDIVALQKKAGMDRDDGKMEMYQYNRLVTGLPQHQIDDSLSSRKKVGSDGNDSEATSTMPLLGEVAMTMGMELRRAYINSLAVIQSGTIVSGLDDGHVQLWRRGQLVKDARHPGARVDHVLTFPSSAIINGPSFVTAGDGSICMWTDEGNHLMQFGSHPGTTPASIAVGSILCVAGNTNYLAACFRVTRQVDPNQFRLVPQNEAERRRRDVAMAQERAIQHQLLRVSNLVKVWYYDGSQGGPSIVREEIISPDAHEDETAPITKLLNMDGRLISGDAWGGIHIFEWVQSSESNNIGLPLSRRQYALMQFRGSSIACMEQVEEKLLAVSIQPEQNAGVLASATPIHVTRPRGIYIVDIDGATIKAVLDAHSDTVQCICRLPDGGILSAGGKMDATVRVWESLTAIKGSDSGDDVNVLTGAKKMKQPGYVFDLKVLPDSKGSNMYALAAARYNVIKIVI
ncbi:hypothetical protein ACHAXR_008672 [Thalassiosira sp. AJA248-18]